MIYKKEFILSDTYKENNKWKKYHHYGPYFKCFPFIIKKRVCNEDFVIFLRIIRVANT